MDVGRRDVQLVEQVLEEPAGPLRAPVRGGDAHEIVRCGDTCVQQHRVDDVLWSHMSDKKTTRCPRALAV
jgi:hypothetical protein